MDKIFKKNIINLSVSIIICLAFLFIMIFFLSSMSTKMNRVIEVKERIASYEKNKKAFADEAEKLQLLQKRLIQLEKLVITNESVPVMLSTFETIAQNIGTEFEITSVQTPTENETKKLLVELNIKGSYTQVQSFLGQIQHQPFQIQINKLSLLLEPSVEPTPSLGTVTNKTPVLVREKQWQGAVTIEILSF